MTRTRASAKAAGATFERIVADYLAANVSDVIDRKVRTGSKDTGDIGGVRLRGHRIVIEAKNSTRTDLAGWIAEAQLEAENDGAAVGVIAHKRHGVGAPGRQWVTMTLADFAWILAEAQR